MEGELLPNCQQQLPCSPQASGCPCMQGRGHYPLLPGNETTGEETPETGEDIKVLVLQQN